MGVMASAQDLPFKSGETLRYSVMFKWGAVNTEVAQAVMKLDSLEYNGAPAYKTQITARTAPFFDIFYSIRENFQSWFSIDGQRPLKYTRDTDEDGYIATNLFLYDWDANLIHADIRLGSREPMILDIPLEEDVYDLASLVFYLRTLDRTTLRQGDIFPLLLALDDDVFNIQAKCEGYEVLKVRRLGRMKTWHFSFSVVAGALFDEGQQLQVWFADDDNFLPVAIMVPLKMGAVRGWLKSYEGLKYPFDARL